MLQSVNPFDGTVLFQAEYLTLAMAEKAIQHARSSFEFWKTINLSKRIEATQKLSLLLRNNKDALAILITKEMGKRITESEAEIEKCASLCDYYSNNAEVFLLSQKLTSQFSSTQISYEPLGVIMGVMPWNFPFWQVIRFAVPTLLAGNTIVLKHASNVSLCSLELQKLFQEAIGEANVFQSLLLRASDVTPIIKNGWIDGVSLTGSEDAGRKVGEAAGTAIIKQVYELGGNDSFIVLKDADVKISAENAAHSRLINAGQSCISAKRFIVHEAIAYEFLQILSQEFEKRVAGNPINRNTSLAPLAKREFVEQISLLIKQSVKQGANPLLPLQQNESFIFPNVLLNVNKQNRLFDEELFAPVATFHTFKDDNEALHISNSSKYGLSSSVWSNNVAHAQQFSAKIHAGSVYINTFPQSDASVPFGGIKFSGYGREMGRDGLLEFVNKKAIVLK